MPTVELEDAEWSQVISIIAAQHPLIAKISQQLVAQRQAKGNGHAAEVRLQPRNDLVEHPRAVSPREPATVPPADHRDRDEPGKKRSARK